LGGPFCGRFAAAQRPRGGRQRRYRCGAALLAGSGSGSWDRAGRHRRSLLPADIGSAFQGREEPTSLDNATVGHELIVGDTRGEVCMVRRNAGALLAAVCAAASVPTAGSFAVPRSVLPLQLRGGGGGVFAFFTGQPRKRTLMASAAKMSAVPTPTTEMVDIQKCMGNWLASPAQRRGRACVRECVRARALSCCICTLIHGCVSL
jgi:hypothetical protein